ncbi:type II toxin-antitoxin system RelE/ParE family toxin [Vandammella animalimorsus]
MRYSYCLVFYVARSDRIDVWRVLHERRDMPAWLHPDEPSVSGFKPQG